MRHHRQQIERDEAETAVRADAFAFLFEEENLAERNVGEQRCTERLKRADDLLIVARSGERQQNAARAAARVENTERTVAADRHGLIFKSADIAPRTAEPQKIKSLIGGDAVARLDRCRATAVIDAAVAAIDRRAAVEQRAWRSGRRWRLNFRAAD